ncbi:MAG: ABC transporter permease subunit [Dehalococcoidia bacterium]|nr:ABC transporter permease subunit [Dehalococcoidia bacterium]
MRTASSLGKQIAVAPAFLLLIGLFVAPLSLTVLNSFGSDDGFTIENYANFFSNKIYLISIVNTLRIGFCSTALIVPLGLLIVLAVRQNRRVRNFMKVLTTIPAVFPSYVFAIALIYIYGSAGILNQLSLSMFDLELPTVGILYSWKGIILANIMFYMPFFIAPVFAKLETLDPSLEEAARSLGSHGFHLIRRIVLPALTPGILAGALLTLLLTLNEFGVVLYLGWGKTYTLTFALYSEMEYFRPAMASVVAVMILLLSASVTVGYRKATRFLEVRP